MVLKPDWMVVGVDGRHKHPDFSEILLESPKSPNWGKLWNAVVL